MLDEKRPFFQSTTFDNFSPKKNQIETSLIFAVTPEDKNYFHDSAIKNCTFKDCTAPGSIINFSNKQNSKDKRYYCKIEGKTFDNCKCGSGKLFVSKGKYVKEKLFSTQTTNTNFIEDKDNKIINQRS